MSGTSTLLSGWFAAPEMANGPEQDHIRDDILEKCFKCTAWAARGDAVIMRVDGGVVVAQVDQPLKDLVKFDYNQFPQIRRVQFWMNKSSVKDLGDHLRTLPLLRVDFDSLFLSQEV